MNNYDTIKSLSFHEFAKWLDAHGEFDGSPWMKWFNENYCAQCPAETVQVEGFGEGLVNVPVCWCEVNNGCKFFPKRESKEPPSSLEIIELWLIQEEE